MKMGSLNAVFVRSVEPLVYLQVPWKIQENGDCVQIGIFLILWYISVKNKIIISLGMWTEHNTTCLLVILLNEIYYIYIYTYTHTYMQVCIYIYVLSFVFCI